MRTRDLALHLEIAGWVRNREGWVEIDAEGTPTSLETFIRWLREKAPRAARVARVEAIDAAPTGTLHFEIRPSLYEF